jgi:glycosyltransferase involved in cell wall biosynthesis
MMTDQPRMPTISAIIPAHNSERTLPLCLQGIKASSTPVHEIIVVSDGSTDATCEIAQQHGVRVIELSSNHQANFCRNAGAAQATGEILLFLDSDAVLQPEAIQNALDSLSDGHFDAVVGLYSAQHRHPNVASQYKNLWIRYSYLKSRGSVDWIFGAISLIQKEAFTKAGGFDRSLFMHKGGDLELGKRMAHARPSIILNPTVEAEHLKQHTLLSLLRNDLERSQGFVQLAANLGQLSRSLTRGFVNVYPRFVISTLISWPLVLGALLTICIPALWWGFATLAALYVGLNVSFLHFFATHRGAANALRVVGILFLDHLVCALGSAKGFIRWLASR